MPLDPNYHLAQQRDGLLKEADYLNKRLKIIHETVDKLNSQIQPSWPACSQCGSRSLRCGCD